MSSDSDSVLTVCSAWAPSVGFHSQPRFPPALRKTVEDGVNVIQPFHISIGSLAPFAGSVRAGEFARHSASVQVRTRTNAVLEQRTPYSYSARQYGVYSVLY